MPLEHVTITASDLAASLRFYDAALAPLGLSRVIELVDEEEGDAAVEAVGYGPETAVLWVVAGTRVTRSVHVCLRAVAADDVERFHAAAVAHGGRSHDAPRRWALYRRGSFNAIVADPDGNLIEAVADEALTGP